MKNAQKGQLQAKAIVTIALEYILVAFSENQGKNAWEGVRYCFPNIVAL